MEIMRELQHVESEPPGMQYETNFGNSSSIITMALGDVSGAGSVFMVVSTNSSGDNVTGNNTQSDPFTMPVYILVITFLIIIS
jgi:hypothetical protein